MKQQILEILDKSTNNGMKAKEIVEVVRRHVLDCIDDYYNKCVEDTPQNVAARDNEKIFMVGKVK